MRRGDPGGRPRRRVLGVLVLSAVLVIAVGVVLAVKGDPVRGAAYAALGLASAAVVGVLVGRAPGPSTAAAGVLSTAAVAVQLQPGPPFALLPFAVAVAVAVASGAWIWAVASVGAAYLLSVVLLYVGQPQPAIRGFGAMPILLVALGAGLVLRSRRARRQAEAHERVDRERRAVEAERLRIARELHDVLAHSLSSISVQAGVGLHLAADRPEAATEALAAIRAVSGEALGEVRGVLGVLRGDDAAPLRPEPDVDGVAALVDAARSTGARVSLVDDLRPRPSRPAQSAVHRVVQEALTNARRHAPGSAVEIRLGREEGRVVARIRDLAGRAPEPLRPGNGITGMRERAAALGGTLETLLRPDGLEVVLALPDGSPT